MPAPVSVRRPLTTWRHSIVATDPGRARLTNATSVAAAVLISMVCAWSIVHFGHGDPALLSLGAFLALQAGLMVRDATAPARLLTTALLIIPVTLAMTVATLLDRSRPVEITVFIGLGGLATWLRRFGPRASALGNISFFGYFFALLLRPSLEHLPEFILVAACAIGSELVVRTALLRERPRRQIRLLLTELRGAGSAALATATSPGIGRTERLRARIRRIDVVAQALGEWRDRYRADRYLGTDAETLATRVLNARTDLEQACYELAQLTDEHGRAIIQQGPLAAALADLQTALTENSSSSADATARARAALADAAVTDRATLARLMVLRSTVSQHTLRAIDLQHPPPAESAAREPAVPTEPTESVEPEPAEPAGRPWEKWAPTSRMAIQVMVATALATIAGEAISASRWYWAVLTAFLVFVGTSTRGDILTRAWRRILGTMVGIVVGLGVTLIADGNAALLTVVFVCSVFGMLYFGPLQYSLQTFFITVMLAAIFGMLGVLNRHVLELRLEETLVGAAIGVVCAYLIFSASSRPAERKAIRGYFAALDEVLLRCRQALTGGDGGAAVLAAVTALDEAHTQLDSRTSSMSLTYLNGRWSSTTHLKHLMDAGTRSTEAFASAVRAGPIPSDDAARLGDAVELVRADLRLTRSVIADRENVPPVDPEDTEVLDRLRTLSEPSSSPAVTAMLMLARVRRVLLSAIRMRQDER